MATLFGKLIRGISGGFGSRFPSSSPVGARFGVLPPAQMSGVKQEPSNITTLIAGKDMIAPDPQKSGLSKFLDSASGVLDIAVQAKELVSKSSPEKTVDGGWLSEVVVKDTKLSAVENGVEKVKDFTNKLVKGKPLVTMGQEFSIGNNIKIPVYIGLALLAYKLLKGGK